LIGINTAIASRSGGNNGVGFAIPVSMANPVLDSIIATGSVRRGFLGVQPADVDAQTSAEFDLQVSQGALIRSVVDDQPAALAGLRPGDVVTQIDGKVIKSGTQLRNYIAGRTPGAPVNLVINRNGEVLNLTVNLEERTEASIALFEGDDLGAFGASVEPLTPETAKQYRYDSSRRGLIVTSVVDDGAAARGGIQAGDILESANNQPLESVAQLRSMLKELEKTGEPIRMIVRRGNSTEMLVVR
ncbi:MAG: PDZ domain-containing protein, partial [Planctomycetota bacterium]